MAKFCSWCGAALEPGARYCSECGARVLESVTVDGSAESVDPMRGFDIVGGEAVPADKTARLDRDRDADPADTDTLVLPTDNAQKRFVLEKTPRKSRAALIACGVVIAVLLAVVIALAYMQMGARSNTGEDASSNQVAPSTEVRADRSVSTDSNATAPVAEEPQGTELTDDQAFSELDAAYARLSAYDERVGDCVEDFNALFLTKSKDKRTTAKNTAETLLGDLQDELKALEELNIPDSSPYSADAADIVELYDCQVGRVSSLVDAWTVDVSFEVPFEHKDEILEALARNNEGGTNKYLTRYDELYPQAKPEKK